MIGRDTAATPGVRHAGLEHWLAKAWPSYALIAALQVKVLWGIFRYRDLTAGDTGSYFQNAYGWYERLTVNIVWSPLYTAFYGSVFALTGDAYVATTAHRVLIVMAATLGVLALMRALLPPALALAIAAWWAILPINFNTLYEVHLFALLPVLAIWLVAAKFDRPAGRAIALALFAATVALVRNELSVAAGLFAVRAARESIALRRSGGRTAGAVLWRVFVYAVPLILAAALIGAFYSRSIVRGRDIEAVARAKHTVNMCQVYAFGYSQRHPEWTKSPWTDCYDLAESTFGERTPSLRQMIAANPRAVIGHFAWNLALTPAGLQLALFNGTWGGPNPDYAPVEHPNDLIAVALTVAACVVVAFAVVVAGSNWRWWWHAWFRDRRGAWLAMMTVACVSVPVILTQRPRPSYLFALTAFLMAVIGSAVHVATNRRPTMRDYACLAGVLVALMATPSYFVAHKSDRPLETAYHVLLPWAETIANPRGIVVMGDYAEQLRAYAHLRGVRQADSYAMLDRRPPDQTLQQFLDNEQVSVFFVQPRIAPIVATIPGAADLLSHPASFGWKLVTTTTPDGRTWQLLYRD